MGSISASNISKSDCRAVLAARLRGQTIAFPDISHTIYSTLTPHLNDTNFLAQRLEPWLVEYVPTEGQRVRHRKVNTPLACSHFFPRVPIDKFAVLGSFYNWAFLWDDEIDCGMLTLDKEGYTDAYCDDSIAFIKSCMQPELQISRPAPGRLHNCGPFIDIGAEMQYGQSKVDRDRLVAALVDSVNSIRAGQALWHVGIASVEDYMERRRKSVGTIPFLCASAWGYDLRLPESLWSHEAMQAVMREVTIGIALYNDVVSLKKELEVDVVDSIVPILVYHHNVSAQVAGNMTVRMLEKSYQDLLAAVERLQTAVSTEHEYVKRDIKVWIDACFDMLIGNVAWSLTIPRYLPRTAFSEGHLGFEVVL